MKQPTLIGGEFCLDFCNTVDDVERDQGDQLVEWSDFISWAVGAGVLDEHRAAGLREWGRREPDRASRELALAKQARSAIYQAFAAIASGEAPRRESLDQIKSHWERVLEHARLVESDDRFAWSWDGAGPDDPAIALGPLLESAVALLTGERLGRVVQCDGPDCTWMFLDTSRGRRRRWCRMSTCGNRAKARRHYAKVKVGD